MPLSTKEMSNRIRPQIDKAYKKELEKAKKKYEKEREKIMTTSKKDKDKEVIYRRINEDSGLDDIVKMKKQQAVSGELDKVLFQQEKEKNRREKGDEEIKIIKEDQPNVIQQAFMADPEKLKDLSAEEIMKYGMIMGGGSGKGIDPTSMLLMNMFGGKNQSSIKDFVDLFSVLKKMDKDEGQGGQPNWMQQIVVIMNLMKMMNPQQGQPKDDRMEYMLTKIFDMLSKRDADKDVWLREKIRDLEMRGQSDPMGEAARFINFFKGFKGLLGGTQTPEGMEHEFKMSELDHKYAKESAEMEKNDKRMEQVQGILDKSIGKIAEAFAQPAADKLKEKITESLNPQPEQPENTYRTQRFQTTVPVTKPIDLIEQELNIEQPPEVSYEPIVEPRQPPVRKKRKMQVFSQEESNK